MANDNEYISASLWHNLPDDLPYKGSVKRVLLQAKAENVAPIIYGEWIVKPDFMMDVSNECSVCGKEFILLDGTAAIGEYHYCPNCGAYMCEEDEA